jgi:hypothetical protein
MNVESDEAYSIEWRSEKPFENYKPKLEEINFLDEEKGRYIYVPVTKADIQYSIETMGENEYDIFFSGSIEFELDPEQKRILEKEGYHVDYFLTFSGADGEVLCSGDDELEFVHNINIDLEDFEAL